MAEQNIPNKPVQPPVSPQNAGEENIPEARRAYSKACLFMFLFGAGWILLINAVWLMLGKVFSVKSISESVQYAIIYGIQIGINLPLTLWLAHKFGSASKPAEHKMNAGKIILAFFCCETLGVAGNIVGTFFNAFLTRLLGFDTTFTALQESVLGDAGIMFMLCAVLIAPITEELMFRKVLIDQTRKYGDGSAILLSGLLFGLMHGNFTQFFYTFALGCFLAFIYVRTGRVRYTVTLHVMVNSLGTLVPIFLKDYLRDLQSWSERLSEAADRTDVFTMLTLMKQNLPLIIYGICIWAIVITGLVLLIVFRKNFHVPPPEKPVPRGKRMTTMCINLGFFLFALFSAYRFAVLMA